MGNRVAIGVVSTSWWVDTMHLPALASHPEVDLAAICGRNRDKALEIAGKYDIPNVYTDHQRMLEEGGLDALVVAVPDDVHYQITMDALAAGLHVVCEKPLASSAEQARDMYEKAVEAGIKHMTYFTWRWLPCFKFMKERVQEGFLGRPYTFWASFRGSYGRDTEYQWRFDQRRANGVLGDLGSHMIDFAHWCVGDITGVNSHLRSFLHRADADGQPVDPANDSAILNLIFKNGAHGQIVVDAMSHLGHRGIDMQVEVHGEKGMLETRMTFEKAEVLGGRGDDEEIRLLYTADFADGGQSVNPMSIFENQPIGVRYFIDCIVEDKPVSPSFRDGWKAQRVVDAAIESNRTGKWVTP